MELETLYEMLAKNIIYEMKVKKENCLIKFMKNFSCRSSCAIQEEEDNFQIIMEHIRKLESHKQKINNKNKIGRYSIV